MYPDSPVYILLSIAVTLLSVVFAIIYNREIGLIGLRALFPLLGFVYFSWYCIVVEFLNSFFLLAKEENGIGPLNYVLGGFHLTALALFAVSVYQAAGLMFEIAVEDSIRSHSRNPKD